MPPARSQAEPRAVAATRTDPVSGFSGAEISLLNTPPLNLWFNVRFVFRPDNFNYFSWMKAECPALKQNVNRHPRGRNQQRNQRDEEAQD